MRSLISLGIFAFGAFNSLLNILPFFELTPWKRMYLIRSVNVARLVLVLVKSIQFFQLLLNLFGFDGVMGICKYNFFVFNQNDLRGLVCDL